ncbi:hypothetical protein BASA81_006671 [Batrachochytrium salamandrivorans]|nr:hypothetical protein BASA81_006671 [Batrachochytrium salamandrivorans]
MRNPELRGSPHPHFAMPVLDRLTVLAKRTALLVLLADVVHCYRFIVDYQTEADKPISAEEEQQIVKQYEGDCESGAVVTNAEYEQRVNEALQFMESYGSHHDHAMFKVFRESIGFAGGGRAAFMQLAHPFVAAGIRDHSYLQNGVRKRFYNTFRYVFGMVYGDAWEIRQASRAVRALHNKVHGELEEHVGVFTPQSRFDANQKDAMRYVQWTLLESSVFEYELLVGALTEQEKNDLAVASSRFLLLFGVDDQSNITWKQFKHRLDATNQSKLIQVSETALDTQEFLFLPPAPQYAPLMGLVKWTTLVALPTKIARQFGGREYTTLGDRVGFALIHGLVRFLYRFFPGSFRYLGAYWKMMERETGPRGWVSTSLSKVSAAVAKFLVSAMMPERDPDQAIQAVREIRKGKRSPIVGTNTQPIN